MCALLGCFMYKRCDEYNWQREFIMYKQYLCVYKLDLDLNDTNASTIPPFSAYIRHLPNCNQSCHPSEEPDTFLSSRPV